MNDETTNSGTTSKTPTVHEIIEACKKAMTMKQQHDERMANLIKELCALTPIQSITLGERSRWHPPDWGAYCELGPEDECWARPLGIGWVESPYRVFSNYEPLAFTPPRKIINCTA